MATMQPPVSHGKGSSHAEEVRPPWTETEWGVRWEINSGWHVDSYGDNKAGAERAVAALKRSAGQTITLVSREVTYTRWQLAPCPASDDT